MKLELLNSEIFAPFFSFQSCKNKSFLLFTFFVLSFSNVKAQNSIVSENLLQGNSASEWDISGAGDLTIQGFATDISINVEETVNFKIKSPASYTIDIYRLGWYDGDGARKVSTLNPVLFDAVLPQTQPADNYEVATGKTSCSNWSISAHWNVPANAVSGIYIAKLTRTDTNGSSHIAFIVRNDFGNSELLFKTSDATWQAYNVYGGNSLYVNNSGISVLGFNHATKVSYDRPFYTRNGGGGGGSSEDWLFNAEYPMIRWLERNGYDVSYTTDVDMDRSSSIITPTQHKVLLSVGHDEYWSATERAKFETARSNGVHLAFFSGNEVYWKTRWEDNHRTLVCYKEGTQGENVCGTKCDPLATTWTGLWRDGCDFPSADGCNPENSLSGQISWEDTSGAIQVTDAYKNLRFWRNTDVALLSNGQTMTLSSNTIGYEWDSESDNGKYPPGRIQLSNTLLGGKVHKLSLYRHQNNSLVFGAGTVQWSWGLDGNHDRGESVEDANMQQATINLFVDMGVLPATIQVGMVADSPIDTTAPSSSITSVSNGAIFSIGTPITISGSASDIGGVVAGIEISVDGGTTWSMASGTTNWSFYWSPIAVGNQTIRCRAFDDNGNMQTAGINPINIIINATSLPSPNDGLGGPILVISSTSNPFSRYAVEILRAEGLNEFFAMDITAVTSTTLNNYDVVILGEMPLNAYIVTMLTDWVNNGGTLIAFKPDLLLAPLLGVTPAAGNLSDKYILIQTNNGPGVGLVGQTIQFHGTADYYTLTTAISLATLYSDASTATVYPAVTTNNVGENGGKTIAFTYDLAKSIIYTRQGNPLWAGQERDGQTDNIRSSDMFYPNWNDMDKVAIPQADEQQHLLANIILQSNLHRKPLPRFWFLPRKLKAAVVMTGDDHGSGGTIARFNQYLGYGNNSAQDIVDWKSIRGTSYIYTNTPITNSQATSFESQGFEISLHISTNCGIYDYESLGDAFDSQMPPFLVKYNSLSSPKTNRTHCISWSDWASKPKIEVENGIRLNADYYYWPAAWVQNRPGMFTGSGMPMRFADIDGTLIDNYQLTTQIPDESGIAYASFINTVLDNAIGPLGYYGVFCANMHTDADTSVGSDAIIASAIARNIPVISAKQLLTWLDARNASNFNSISWNAGILNFVVNAEMGATKLQGMIPIASSSGQLTSITHNGSPINYSTEVIKGINYAFFDAVNGNYAASYLVDNEAPIISTINATPNSDGTVTITWTTNELTTSSIDYGTTSENLNLNRVNNNLTTNHSITINGLNFGSSYYYRITSVDTSLNSSSEPIAPASFSFTMMSGPCVSDTTIADFNVGTTGANTYITQDGDGSIALKPTITEEFNGSSVPVGWQSFGWTGGTSIVSGGSVVVDGARFNTVSPIINFSSGSSIEFRATFGASSFQHIGFGGGTDAIGTGGIYNGDDPWAMFSTGSSTSQLQARTYMGSAGTTNINIGLDGEYIGTSHLYRIEWKAASIDFYVDGVLMNSTLTTIGGTMRPAISDYSNGGANVVVDWMNSSPYAPTGSYISAIYDVGTAKNWEMASWNETIPVGTTLQLSHRQSNSATAILSEPWNLISTNGAVIGGTSQYIQYKADFTTSNLAVTPILKDIIINCSTPSNTAPIVTMHPTSVSKCAGEEITLISAASGNPIPTVQWQVSIDNGSTWTDILSAINSTYTFTSSSTDNGKQFKAIWTNTIASQESNTATITINPLPTATIEAVSNSICPGGSIVLQLAEATGSSPYTLTVNGTTYSNVSVGQNFATFNTAEQSIWGNSGLPTNPSVTDNTPIEVGTKFRSTQNGYITGIRFYKGITNIGVHTANLWTVGGTLLASANFTAETASGWQEVRFTAPIAITANTTYIASYLSQSGYFAISAGFFASSGVTNGFLTALQSGVDGPNGVYIYGGGFPNNGNTANYWVDVLFTQGNITGNYTYDLTSVTDATSCTNTGTPLSSVVVTTNPFPSGVIVSSTPSVCEGNSIDLTFNATVGEEPFELEVNGTLYPNIFNGIPFSVGVASNVSAPKTIWNSSIVGGSQSVDNTATELGLRFTSSESGTISGIRFYKTGTNSETFIGSLWDLGNTTTPLATASYTSDSTIGWKEIVFLTPIPIAANTSYIVSYFSPNSNYYAYTSNGLSTPIINAPLTAEASFYKQPGPGYPTTSSSANYWVDPIFNSSTSNSIFNLTKITSFSGCVSTGTPISTATVSVNSNSSIIPTFDSIPTICNGDTSVVLPTTSLNGITGIWNPAFNPNSTTTYTFTPSAPQCAAIVTLTIAVGNTTTWTGLPIGWDNGEPISTSTAIISANYSEASNINACTLTINNDATVVIPSSYNVFLSGALSVNSGSFTLNNNANLIQSLDVENFGNIIVKRESSPISRLDYTLWSSPVENQMLKAFSPGTLSNRFYRYDPTLGTSGLYAVVADPITTPFLEGIGYLIRASNWHPTTPTIWQGTYTGVPNNGNVSIIVSNGTYNAIGNPYPSTIDADAFIDANNLVEPLYFWRKINNLSTDPLLQTPSYATYTKAGGVGTTAANSSGGSTIVPNGVIQVGQGFITKSTSTTLNFTNSFRIADNNNQFLKSNTSKSRYWLNLYQDSNLMNQMMIAYMPSASLGIDAAIDGRFLETNIPTQLSSIINNEEYVVQGRPTFNVLDVVALGFKTQITGNYTITLDHVDGLFSNNQEIFIKDNFTNTVHNLSESGYDFYASAGTNNMRFEIVYQETLANDEVLNDSNYVNIYKQNDEIVIDAGKLNLKSVKVFDLLGRVVADKKNIHATKTKLNVGTANQVLLVQIYTEDNKISIKKVIN